MGEYPNLGIGPPLAPKASHIQKRQRGGEVRYYLRWRFDGREKVRSFARARDAETVRRQVEHDQVLGLQVDPSRGAVTFGAYAEE